MSKEVRTGTVFAAAFLIVVGYIVATSYAVMLLVGGLHHEVSKDIPALGFGATALLLVAISTVVGIFRKA